MNFAQIAEGLFALKAHGPKFGIDRMRALAAALGHPERLTPCIHVAGTNGKGSVAAMLESVLRTAGWKTGLYTSPHLVHLGERVQVNRRSLTEAEIAAFVRELTPVAARVAAADPTLRPSFFEWMTAMAWLHFARESCDVALIEVGLGGRLDATNVVTPEVAVITSIGLDHCEMLGGTLAQIAAEKAGIIKAGVPVVVGRMPREAEKVIRATAAQVGAPIRSVAEAFPNGFDAVPRPALEGEYQQANAATVLLVAQALGPCWRLTTDVVARGLAAVEWAGRWQRIRVGGRRVILDTSHNPEGAEVLEANLARLVVETGRAPVVVVGALGEARARPLLAAVARHARQIYLVVPTEPRACGHDELTGMLPPGFDGVLVRSSVAELFPGPDQCTAGGADDTVVVTGSVYLVGEVMTRLRHGR